MKEQLPGQGALEGLEPPPGSITPPRPRTAPDAPAVEAVDGKKPRWAKYRAADAYKCDRCISDMVEGGPMHAPNRATHTRTHNGVKQFLCYPHTQEQRQADGLKAAPR